MRAFLRPAWCSFALALAFAAGPVAGSEPSASEEPWIPIAFPGGAGAMAPNLVADGDGALLTWLERAADGASPRASLWLARFSAGEFSAPVRIHGGEGFFANWADFPSAARAPDGSLIAHWLEKLGDGPYAYGAQLARSTDDGATWQPLGLLHDDASPTEHGFVSFVGAPRSATLWAFWLDGRAMASDGPMQLRTARFAGGAPQPSLVLDDRVCECCQTDAAAAADGPVVVYRNRVEGEIRDIYLIRGDDYGWSEPIRVAEDGWRIDGCPVNGPAVAADGERVVVAWFTAGSGSGAVRVAGSRDGGRTFEAPLDVEGDGARGRVDVQLAGPGRAWITYLGRADGEPAILLRAVDLATTKVGEARTVAATSGARAAGFPRTALTGAGLLVAWVDPTGETSTIRSALLSR